jgi:hypothetical protein
MSVVQQLAKAATATRVEAGLFIVRKVLSENASGLTTQELYRLALKEKPASAFRPPVNPAPRHVDPKVKVPPTPPHLEHPVQSMSFLKRTLLPTLEQKREFRKARITRTIEQHQSTANQPTGKAAKRKATSHTGTIAAAVAAAKAERTSTVDAWVWRPFSGPKRIPDNAIQWPKRKPFGEAVGMGEDWSHLNKRRQRARTRKVASALVDMKFHGVKKMIMRQRGMRPEMEDKLQSRRASEKEKEESS